MTGWQPIAKHRKPTRGRLLLGSVLAAVSLSILAYDFGKKFFAPSPLRAFEADESSQTSDCARLGSEARRFPEIGRVLSLVRPVDCAVYRGTVPAGNLLSAPGTYLAVADNSPNRQWQGEAVDVANHEAARKILADAGWREDATIFGGGYDRLHGEFRRILPDGTRQYFHVKTGAMLEMKVVSLPKPRLNLNLPGPTELPAHFPLPKDEGFAELPPFPGLAYQGLIYAGNDQYFTPADSELKREAYSWWAPKWVRRYRYDSVKIPALAATLLYKDALREAGWQVGKDYGFQGMPDSPHVSAKLSGNGRELIASLGLGNGEAYISLIDIEFQRKVAELLRQWKTACVALIPDLEFATGQSDLSDSSIAALELLLEARQVDGRDGRTDYTPSSVLELRGRADPTGNRKSNLDLGLARANAVRAWLIEHDVPSESLGVSSFGDWDAGAMDESLPRRTVSVAKLDCTPKEAVKRIARNAE